MDWNFKKMWPLAAASLVAFTSLLNADDQNNNSMSRAEGPNREINPSANPRLSGGHDWFLTGEVLFWNSHQDGLEYAISCDQYVPTGAQLIDDANTLEPNHKWDVGYRFGVGYVFDHDGWDAYLNWTHFNNRASGSEDADTTNTSEILIALWSDVSATAEDTLISEEIDTTWKLRLDLIDLELGREFYTSKWLSLRPHIGLRGAIIKQRYEINYLGNFLNTSSTASNVQDDVNLHNYFEGLGVRSGLNSLWTMGCGWSLFGDVGLSLLYGYFDVSVEESTRTDATSSSSGVLDLKRHFRSSRSILDLALGLQYDHTFMTSNTHLGVSLGWEHHMFFNQNQLWRVNKIASGSGTGQNSFCQCSGDLSTQGWTLSARLDF